MTNIIAARLLPQETFGQFMMIRNTISSFEWVISGTLSSPMIKRISEASQKDTVHIKMIIAALFFTNTLIALVLSLLIYATSPLLIKYFFIGETSMLEGLAIGTLILISTTIATSIQSILTGLEEFKKLAFAGVSASIVSLPIIIYLIYTFGLNGALFGVVIYFLSDFIFKYFKLKHNRFALWEVDKATLKHEGLKLLGFSTPLFLSVFISSISFWYGRVLVVNSSGSFSQVAIFDAAYQWLTIIMIITGATTSVALPMLAKAFAMQDKSNVSKTFWLHLSINGSMSVVFAIIFSLLSPQIMSLYGTQYTQGYDILIILSIVSIFFTLSSLLNKTIIVKGNPKTILFSSLVSSLIFFTVLYNFDSTIYALAYAFLGYYISNTFIYTYILIGKQNE